MNFRLLAAAKKFSSLHIHFWSDLWYSKVSGSIISTVAVRSSNWRQVVRALLAMAYCVKVECNQVSWSAFHRMSGFDASFSMQVAMVSRHARTIYETSVVAVVK